jgi:nucleoside-diphosphate-sugar epimerase
VSLLEALDTLAGVTGIAPQIVYSSVQRGDAHDTWASLDRAKELLGYAPTTGLAEGLAAEWEWLLSMPRAG